jgi:hypothetical protein
LNWVEGKKQYGSLGKIANRKIRVEIMTNGKFSTLVKVTLGSDKE